MARNPSGQAAGDAARQQPHPQPPTTATATKTKDPTTTIQTADGIHTMAGTRTAAPAAARGRVAAIQAAGQSRTAAAQAAARPGGGDHGDHGPGRAAGAAGAGGAGGRPVLPEVTAPLATLQRRAERAGENRLLGPLDPALTRDLAAAAARSHNARWEITIVDDHGYAIGHGIARPPPRPRPRQRQQPQPPPGPAPSALPARMNITVTETLLHQLVASAQPRSGAPPGDWHLAPRTVGAEDGAWDLTLPGGRELTVRFDVVPTHSCDHRYQVNAYQPGDRLRRLVQVRDHECTFPPCSRPAASQTSNTPSPTTRAERPTPATPAPAAARCHQVKQTKGWTVTQPKPGWHVWTTPTGRTYTQEPWRYIA